MQATRTTAKTQFLRSAVMGSVLTFAFLTAPFQVVATPGSSNTQHYVSQSERLNMSQSARPNVLQSARPKPAYKSQAAKSAMLRRDKPQLVRNAYRASESAGLSCVPYARMVSGIAVAGNAWQWWGNAAGAYARGNSPERGSVMAFRGNRAMPLGHVAVVSRVVNGREVLIDHSNWPSGQGRGAVSRNVAVIDVSEANDWSAVRVELPYGGDFGSVYPVYGFIYDRPDSGVMVASARRPEPRLALNPAPRDLRPAAEQPRLSFDETAEAPARRRAATARRH